jgi:hypothetical protein
MALCAISILELFKTDINVTTELDSYQYLKPVSQQSQHLCYSQTRQTRLCSSVPK